MPRTLGTCSVLLTLMRHADRIKIGCATGGLGDLCATDREHTWRGASYYPFTQLMKYSGGVSLQPILECEKYDVEGYAIDDMNQYMGFEDVDSIQTAAAIHPEGNELAVFVLNADEDSQELTLDLRGFEGINVKSHSALYAKAANDRNTYADPNRIIPEEQKNVKMEKGSCTAVLPGLSWNVITFGI